MGGLEPIRALFILTALGLSRDALLDEAEQDLNSTMDEK
jgi:hypothetical protein